MAATKVPNTKELATNLQNQQIQMWLTRLESPETVFKFLMLDKGADNLLANPQLTTCLLYTKNFMANNPYARKVVFIDTLRTNYTDKSLTQMLTAAKEVPRSKKMAAHLEDQLLGRWALAGKTPEYVSKMLGKSAESKYLTKLNLVLSA